MAHTHGLILFSQEIAQKESSQDPFYIEARCQCGQFCLIGPHRLRIVESAFSMHLKVMAEEAGNRRKRA